ncbi:Hypothetical protein, putative [Bodo saltans]|uniref:RUN domain-containing protein n=1 Tax=Bodo saltans TaxID=75058 RepID=A0A0S4JKF9_BODSA|nr:Hypothetical protein, putative [Bodo saltans]|eukprot:CUG90866.1 Hypothetical protein, putative [Bodo saltans]
MVLLIRTSFASASEAVKSRAFIRCALNQGCLLAALEVLGRQFQPILEGYMMDHAVLRQYGSDKWDRLVRVVAPIAGPPLDVFYTVASPPPSNSASSPTRGSASSSSSSTVAGSPSSGPSAGVAFELDLVVPEFDSRKEYMSIVKLYIAGVTDSASIPELPIVVVEEEPPAGAGGELETQILATTQDSDSIRGELAKDDDPLPRQRTSSSTPPATPTDGTTAEPFPADGSAADEQGAGGAASTKKKTVKKVTVVTKRIIKKTTTGSSADGGGTTVVTTTTTRTKSVPPATAGTGDEVQTDEGAFAGPDDEECTTEVVKHVVGATPPVVVTDEGNSRNNGTTTLVDAAISGDVVEDNLPNDLTQTNKATIAAHNDTAAAAIHLSDAEKMKQRKELDEAIAAVERLFARRRAALDAALETVASAEAFLDKELTGSE